MDLIGKIPDYIDDLPIFRGNPNEVSSWIIVTDGIVQGYKPKPNSSVNERN